MFTNYTQSDVPVEPGLGDTKGMRKPYGAVPTDEKTYIRRLRQQRRMTLDQLGEVLGVTGQSVQRWETNGKVNVDMLLKIAAVFDVTPAELLPGPPPLTEEEEALLFQFREASGSDRRAILKLAQALNEADAAAPPPRSGSRRGG